MSYLAIPPGHGCMHEAGHALLATLLGMHVPLVCVRRSGEPLLKLNGRELNPPCFTVAIPQGRPLSSGHATRASMLVAAGGFVADMMGAPANGDERASLLTTFAVRARHDLANLSFLSTRLGDTGAAAVRDSFSLALAVLTPARAPLAEVSNRLRTYGRTNGDEILRILRAYPDALDCVAGCAPLQDLIVDSAAPTHRYVPVSVPCGVPTGRRGECLSNSHAMPAAAPSVAPNKVNKNTHLVDKTDTNATP